MTKYLQESRMREIRTSGSTRGSSGMGNPRPLLSTLLVKLTQIRGACKPGLDEGWLPRFQAVENFVEGHEYGWMRKFKKAA